MAFRLVMVAYACDLNIWEVEEGKLESRSWLAPYIGNWGQHRLYETLSANNQSNKTQIKDTNPRHFTGTCWKHMIHIGVPDVNVATVLWTSQSTACVSIHGSPRSGLQAAGRCSELCCFHRLSPWLCWERKPCLGWHHSAALFGGYLEVKRRFSSSFLEQTLGSSSTVSGRSPQRVFLQW